MKKNLIFAATLLTGVSAFGQIGISTPDPKATLDIVASPADYTKTDGLIAPRLKGAELKAKDSNYTNDQTGAIVYVTEGLDEADTTDKTKNITKVGYYHFDGSVWQKLGHNIYNTDDVFTSDRSAYLKKDKYLLFDGPGYVGIGDVDPLAKLYVDGFIQFSSDSDYGVGRVFNDSTGEKYGMTQSSYFPKTGDADSPGTRLYTSGGVKGHISFGQYTSPTAYSEWARFAHNTGNLGINTINETQNNPTEKLDVNGNVRIRTLPLNGSADVLFTNPDGTRNESKSQPFFATKTVVADNNGILGALKGVPAVTTMYAGGDNNDALGETITTIGAHNYKEAKADLTKRTFTLTKKSIVTFSHSTSASHFAKDAGQYAGYGLEDVYAKLIQVNVRLYSGSTTDTPYFSKAMILRSSMSYTNGKLGGVWGTFYIDGTRSVVLEPGIYTAVLEGYVYAADEDGIRVDFGGFNDCAPSPSSGCEKTYGDNRFDIVGTTIN
ncbi:hypothetical protein [Chryseobacterium sp. BIGb0232]|uniref:hypothetical protein n=1 Tax=Chryseobacterium sp. BIGb0232 TaxID=2940598 RepID=UPI000F46E7FC|nr:hypothetical protein [Chryseobacterium sp. BIGb0232]MCS4304061.1 hypothetical protein [Chryseobacterium sp. BIGb0232]ROS17644.1 hypothetical protein EDF65_2017 [Chryseobacterium nakagawai]